MFHSFLVLENLATKKPLKNIIAGENHKQCYIKQLIDNGGAFGSCIGELANEQVKW